MDSKKVIIIGLTVGSVLGGYIPVLWGGSELSAVSVILAAVGGSLGIWLAFKLSR